MPGTDDTEIRQACEWPFLQRKRLLRDRLCGLVGIKSDPDLIEAACEEIELLRAFLRDRVTSGHLEKYGGYHGRRIHMGAKKILARKAGEK